MKNMTMIMQTLIKMQFKIPEISIQIIIYYLVYCIGVLY